MRTVLNAAWERVREAAAAAEEKKGRNVLVLDLEGLSLVADYFLICSGQNRLQVQAIADRIRERMTAAGHTLHHSEGYEEGRWILLDFGDVVAHVFHEDEREYYDLERLWGDANRLEAVGDRTGPA